MADHLSDLQKFQDMWDGATRQGIFAGSPQPDAEPASEGDEVVLQDHVYWDAILRMSRGEYVPDVPPLKPGGLVAEGSKTWPSKAPNPVLLWTQGKDQVLQKSKWFDVADLEKLAKMKLDLHDLGDKAAEYTSPDGSKKAEAVMRRIRDLRKKVDELSDWLGQPAEEKRS